ncbi:MAG: NAD(P)-binding domain-containing protein, partial [Nitrososphaerales archaeon]
MKVGVVGSGVVGYAVGRGLGRIGHSVVFFDVNDERVNWIRNNGFEATNDMKALVRSSEVILICVPTPTV